MTRPPRIPVTRKGGALFVLPGIDDDLEPDEKNALAIRNQCAVDGQCPVCGTVGTVHEDADFPRIFWLVFEHEDYCPVRRDDAA